MVSITLSVPEEVKKKMDAFDEINWSGFVRKCIIAKAGELEATERLAKEEKDLSAWAVNLQHSSRKGRFEALKKKGLI